MNIKDNWNVVSGIVIFLLFVIGTFFYIPEYLEDQSIFSNFGQWVAVIVVGLMLIPMSKWKLRRHIKGWVITTVIFLILSTMSFFLYQSNKQKWTCKCNDKIYVIGLLSGVKDDVKRGLRLSIKEENKNATEDEINKIVSEKLKDCSFMLRKYNCQLDNIWYKESIDRNEFLLAGFYILALPFFILTMMSMLQAVKPYLDKFIINPEN